jgi:hypothetical protein
MDNPQPDSSAPASPPLSPRILLKREWPYLLVLVLALFGIAFTSFFRSPITLYWIVLAPLIGVICVATRWRDVHGRDERIRLVWTQALHWAAVLVAMRLVFVADVASMMNADASALAVLTLLALGTLEDLPCWRDPGNRRPRDRMARAVGAVPAAGGAGPGRDHRSVLLAGAQAPRGERRWRSWLVVDMKNDWKVIYPFEN